MGQLSPWQRINSLGGSYLAAWPDLVNGNCQLNSPELFFALLWKIERPFLARKFPFLEENLAALTYSWFSGGRPRGNWSLSNKRLGNNVHLLLPRCASYCGCFPCWAPRPQQTATVPASSCGTGCETSRSLSDMSPCPKAWTTAPSILPPATRRRGPRSSSTPQGRVCK